MRGVRIAGFVLTAALALTPGAAWAQEGQVDEEGPMVGARGRTAEWNADAVATVADDLAKAVRDARREARNTPGRGVQSGQENAWFLFSDKLRLIRIDAQSLASGARAGRSHDELYNVYRRMWVYVRDVQEWGRRMLIPEPLQAKLNTAGGYLDQLDAYFD